MLWGSETLTFIDAPCSGARKPQQFSIFQGVETLTVIYRCSMLCWRRPESMHIREQSGLGPVLAPSGTPPNYAYTRQKWTWARSGLWTPPCGTPLNYAYTRAKWTWAYIRAHWTSFRPVLGPYGTPQNYAYTRAKWTWAHCWLRTAPCGTPLTYAYTRAKWT